MGKIKFILLLIFSCLLFQGQAQGQKEIDFKKACDQVIQSISQKKLSLLNSNINSIYGVYIIYRSGVYDRYQNLKYINGKESFGTLEGSVFDWTHISTADQKKFGLQYGKLPSFDCGESVWSKKGYIADSVKKYKPLSEIVAFEVKNEDLKPNKKIVSAIKYVEQNSRKIIFTGSKGDGIIFYMIYLNGKWFLSVIDQATTDCSA